MNLRLSIIYCLLLTFFILKSDVITGMYKTEVFQSNIKTMRIFVEGNELSYPIIELFGENKICFEFDLMEDNAKNYVYQIIHCNSNWEQSDLFSDEFMDGFNENAIYDYQYSANTRVKYVHYKVNIPNNDVELKVSGNYIIRVIEDGDRKNTVATARFMIYEPIVNVKAEVQKAISSDFGGSGQEVRFNVLHNELEINDPFSEVKVQVSQNNRPDRVLEDLKPVFVRNNELVYSFSGENIIQGGNEFRMFSTKNLNIPGENVNDIAFVDTMYHVQLRIDERKSYKRYFTQEDLNGSFLVYVNNTYDHRITADYTYVHFYLPFEKPYLDGKVYLYGELNNWNPKDNFGLEYNFDTKMYEGVFLIKQGIYNYAYIYKDNLTNKIDEAVIEGSHYETENDYLIFVYHNGFDNDYDRLVGYQVVNSKFKQY